MPHWTTHELRRLDEAHQIREPTGKELVELFPRYSAEAIFSAARRRGLRNCLHKRSHLEWLTISHLYFARREAEQKFG